MVSTIRYKAGWTESSIARFWRTKKMGSYEFSLQEQVWEQFACHSKHFSIEEMPPFHHLASIINVANTTNRQE